MNKSVQARQVDQKISRKKLRVFLGQISKNTHVSPEADDHILIRHCLSEGLICKNNDGVYALTKAGTNALRRLHLETDPFSKQHQAPKMTLFEFPDGAHHYAAVNLKESPLAWLASRRGKDGSAFLSKPLLAAGERLRTDFERADLAVSVTMNWEHLCNQGASSDTKADHLSLNDSRLSARKRLEEALAYVGPELSPILRSICCHLQKIEQAEQVLGWPRRSGKLVLKIALQRLARHYGYAAVSQSAEFGKISQWGTDDYRPRHCADGS